MLKDLVGLDFSDHDKKRQEYYNTRTEVGRDIARAKANLDNRPVVTEGLPQEEVRVSELIEELDERKTHNADIESKRKNITITNNRIDAQRLKVDEAKELLKRADDTLSNLCDSHTNMVFECEELQEKDVGEIVAKIEGAETVNEKIRADRLTGELQVEKVSLDKEYKRLSKAIEYIDQTKSQALQATVFPVPGLAMGDDSVIYNDIPYSQASTAEQIRVSVAMGIAANPELKILLIRDGSHLDDDNLRSVAEYAAENDAQVWLERVGKGSEVSVIIEDGMVMEDEQEVK